jgi:hypothetical protein
MEKLSMVKLKRSTGVQHEIFEQMPEVLNASQAGLRKHPFGGVPARLSSADKLPLLLMYCREYRTRFHIGVTYGLSESRVCEIIKEAESILTGDSRFLFAGQEGTINLI